MTAEFPQVIVTRQLIEGRGRVTFSLNQEGLQNLLDAFEVKKPSELSDTVLRTLCRRASHAETVQLMERVEEEFPGETALTIDDRGWIKSIQLACESGETGSTNTLELRSSEIGFDTMMRFAREADENFELLCDPGYSPVDFDLRIFDKLPDVGSAQDVGRSVLRVTLEPPDLAQ
ncbi:MAG TPA: hypothetical protein VF733_01730 [Candidatus Saccharimonadales bacterium]